MGSGMRRNAVTLAIGLCVLTACVTPGTNAPETTNVMKEMITGTSGSIDFTLSDSVFNVERPKLVHLLLVAVYLPLVFM